MRQAKLIFTYDGVCDMNLTLSHRKRVEINRRMNLHQKPPDAVFLPCPPVKRDSLNRPQAMWLWPGIELLGCVPMERGGIRNGVSYKVEALTDEVVRLEGGVELPFKSCSCDLRLSHAMTYASVQGRECSGSLCLHDTENQNCTMRHLYVGLSRATAGSNVFIARD